MTVLNKIIPGKVNNRGINDLSSPDYSPAQPTNPLHIPVITGIFPTGPLASEKGTTWLNTADFAKTFGNVMDHKTPYYNPISLLISNLIAGGQSSIGVRRVSVNNQVARVAMSAFVQQVTLPDYQRDLSGNFVRDINGQKVVNVGVTYPGLSIVIQPDPNAATTAVGGLIRRTIAGAPATSTTPAIPDTIVYPLYEAIAGVGDNYNSSGLQTGVRNDSVNFRAISDFVTATGVYPFDLKTFTEASDGTRNFAKTTGSLETVSYTLFKTENGATPYGIKNAFGQFTGTNVNRKVTPIQSPFNSVHIYDDHITVLCQTMYAIEQAHNTSLVDVSNFPYQQMNPFTCVNHVGAPYYAIQVGGVIMWDLSGAVKAQYGVSPFLNADGTLPAFVTKTPLDDPFGVLASAKFQITPPQAWEANNHLIASDMIDYLAGNETKNYTRNRQSFWYDVGYSQAVKDVAIGLLASRKDIIVIPCATVWVPGGTNLLSDVYSRFTSLSSAMRLYPESEQWGTPTCRAAVNLIEAYLTDEITGDAFSGNLDLAYAFALFAGGSSGTVSAAFAPDSGDNRNLRTMHSPNIDFEEDSVASDNFTNGGITLRPRNTDMMFRPALITVYPNADSVLKDLVTNFLCVCIEKLAQDEWNNLCGDTSKTSANYVALFKDNAERACRDALGGLVRQITFTPSYDPAQPGSRATMNAVAHAYFNKGKYMMTLDLFAYNEEDAAKA